MVSGSFAYSESLSVEPKLGMLVAMHRLGISVILLAQLSYSPIEVSNAYRNGYFMLCLKEGRDRLLLKDNKHLCGKKNAQGKAGHRSVGNSDRHV